MPSYARIVYRSDELVRPFYMDQHHFRDGNVMLYKRADHKKQRWQARYRIDGKYVTQSLKTLDFEKAKTNALEHFDELRFKSKHGMPIHKRTFESVADEFIAAQLRRVEIGEITKHWGSTGKSIFGAWKKYLGEFDITKIPQSKIDGYIPWRKKNNRSGDAIRMETLVLEISYFRSCMLWATERKYVGEFQIPVIRIPKIPKHKRTKREAFTRSEYANLHKFMNDWVSEAVDADERYFRIELRYFIMFLGNTGLRPGSETIGLRWKDFEARDGYLFIRIVGGKRGSNTSVAQPDIWAFMNTWRQIGKDTGDDAPVFPQMHHRTGLSNKVKDRVVKLFEDAGVRIGPKGTKRTLYCLRHTYITFAVVDGEVNVFDLSENTRTSVERLQDTYSDVKTEDFAERVVKRKTHLTISGNNASCIEPQRRPKMNNDPNQIADRLFVDHGADGALEMVRRDIDTAQSNRDYYRLSVWRDVRRILHNKRDAADNLEEPAV